MKTPKSCARCIYWRRLSTSGFACYGCHFLLDTGRRRRKGKGGGCLERQDAVK